MRFLTRVTRFERLPLTNDLRVMEMGEEEGAMPFFEVEVVFFVRRNRCRNHS